MATYKLLFHRSQTSHNRCHTDQRSALGDRSTAPWSVQLVPHRFQSVGSLVEPCSWTYLQHPDPCVTGCPVWSAGSFLIDDSRCVTISQQLNQGSLISYSYDHRSVKLSHHLECMVLWTGMKLSMGSLDQVCSLLMVELWTESRWSSWQGTKQVGQCNNQSWHRRKAWIKTQHRMKGSEPSC